MAEVDFESLSVKSLIKIMPQYIKDTKMCTAVCQIIETEYIDGEVFLHFSEDNFKRCFKSFGIAKKLVIIQEKMKNEKTFNSSKKHNDDDGHYQVINGDNEDDGQDQETVGDNDKDDDNYDNDDDDDHDDHEAYEDALSELPSPFKTSVNEAEHKQSNLESKKDIFKIFLTKLALWEKYPQTLSIRDAMTIRDDTLICAPNHPSLLPNVILQKIMMSDTDCRSCLLSVNTPNNQNISSSIDANINTQIHPVDCILALLHCCDDFLRQDIFYKLSLCQFAIPFILPNPYNNSVMFLPWAMRSIMYGWESHDGIFKEGRIVDYKCPIVSFVRIESSESYFSKSEILNAIISKTRHDVCFNWKNCEGGGIERKFMDGLVEMCCYIPSGKDNVDFCTDVITFLNLRGNAHDYSKQMCFLQKVSYIFVAMIDEKNLNDYNIQFLQQLSQSPGGLILLLANNKSLSMKQNQTKMSLCNVLKSCTEVDLKFHNLQSSSTAIKKLLSMKIESKSIEFKAISGCIHYAHEAGIKVDEDNKHCVAGKRHAEKVMVKVDSKLTGKDKMVPLQSKELWCKWADLDKEKCRHDNWTQDISIDKYTAILDDEKSEIRKLQCDKSKKFTSVMDRFIQGLQQYDTKTRIYFLQWLKMKLDDYSRNALHELKNNYKKTRDEIQTLKENPRTAAKMSSKIKDLTITLRDQNDELVNASFGLEHLFREIGQIYESRMNPGTLKSLQQEVERFPKIMAEIMNEGFSLEIMDGDASYVPITWVTAVIDSLKEKCHEENSNDKVFVLSILGIQSTGKSTLLNTMFGLRFNVSAGRCTRGAYLQLIPVHKSIQEKMGCNYLLIVDTEGLRAPEIQLNGYKHDNELATLVIGLADSTIINFSGETPCDLDDILQTALHAFIRMRKIDLHPSCKFVHHNVVDALAGINSLLGRQNFLAKLDEMTLAAAKEEKCAGKYECFCDIIDFNDGQDVFHFKALWNGDPPMASVNPGYSDCARELKNKLKGLVEQKKELNRHNLTTFAIQLNDIWKAVLQENFLFSFKNTLEVSAYNELDYEFNKWRWSMQAKMMEWGHTARNQVDRCSLDYNELGDVKDICIKGANKIIESVHKCNVEKLEKFIKGSNHSQTLLRFRKESEKKLESMRDECKKEAQTLCKRLITNKNNSVALNKLEIENGKKVQENVKELVLQAHQEGWVHSDQDIEKVFCDKWEIWISEFRKNNEVEFLTDDAIEVAVEGGLIDIVGPQSARIIDQLKQASLSERQFTDNFTVSEKDHLNIRYGSESKELNEEDIHSAHCQSRMFLSEACENLDDFKQGLNIFDKELKAISPSWHVNEVLHQLFSSIDDFNKKNNECCYTFTKVYEADIALAVSVYALVVFKGIAKTDRNENDPMHRLEILHKLFLDSFKNQYKQASAEKLAASNLCNLLSISIEKVLQAKLEIAIINDLLETNPRFRSKKGFKIEILECMADLEDFERYKVYLMDIKACYRHWMKYYVESHCRNTKDGKKRRITILAEAQWPKIKSHIVDVVQNLSKFSGTIKDWINEFCLSLGEEYSLRNTDINRMVVIHPVKDFQSFTRDIISGIENKNLEKDILGEYQSKSAVDKMATWKNPPYRSLYNNLIGCSEVCPFCKEQCEKPKNHLGEHEVKLHRPKCLGGYVTNCSEILALQTCTDTAAFDGIHSFRCDDTDYRPVKFTNYKGYYPTWNISKRLSVNPLYWHWFIYKYQDSIVEMFGASGADVPNEWGNISKEAAKDTLSRIF